MLLDTARCINRPEVLRHKSKKEEFRFVFWLTVVVNIGVFIWFFTDMGSAVLGGLLDRF